MLLNINISIKSHRVADWIKKKKKNRLAACRRLNSELNTQRPKVRVEKRFHANGKDKKVGVAIPLADKVDFKSILKSILKCTIKDKEGHCIMTKELAQQADISFINMYVPITGAPRYMKQVINRHIGKKCNNSMDFNSSLIPMNRSSKQKINEKTVILNDTLDQLD